ncbi:hypothetical protein [Anatilimnocola floriformis]|uniref:hypothetical protein n=1 Tax=Anatilimnocola floriformis TaxID=2948575 RepID=UPI0020C23D47|nr:hypothetical protein [Anatilimnocola floriformis]
MRQLLSTRRWLKAVAAAGLLVPLANCTLQSTTAQDRVYRSTADIRPRIPDENDRPHYKERWTHRGFELHNNNMSVIANTNADDARHAMTEALQAWQEAGALADHFTKVHRNPNFGIGALQIVVDGDPQRARDQPLTTLNVVGLKSNLVVHVGKGQPPLDQQIQRVREATVLALLRTTELDIQYPSWVSQGIASYIAQQGESAETLATAAPEPTTANIGGQQWRGNRLKQDVLKPAEDQHQESIARVRFLLEGNDSEHTPAFFAVLQSSAVSMEHKRAGENMVINRRGELQPQIASPQVDQFFTSLANDYAAWQKEPLARQPLYVAAKDTSPELEQLQREMVLVLKLQRRTSPQLKSNFRTKVVAYQQAPKFVGEQKTTLSVADPRDVYRELTDRAEGPWATRDVDGSLLLSSNTDRLEQLFGDNGQRFKRVRQDDSWRLASKLPDGRMMTAWLEENKQNPSRPNVKFDFIDPTKPTPAKVADGGQPRAELGLPIASPPGNP